jgi:hypothetical protein
MKRNNFLGAILAILLLTSAASAIDAPICGKDFKFVVEAKSDDGGYIPSDTFDTSDKVFVWGYNIGYNVDIYVTVDRNWVNGENITALANVVKLKENQNMTLTTYIDLGTFNPGNYDVLIDRDRNGIYNRDCDAVDWDWALYRWQGTSYSTERNKFI